MWDLAEQSVRGKFVPLNVYTIKKGLKCYLSVWLEKPEKEHIKPHISKWLLKTRRKWSRKQDLRKSTEKGSLKILVKLVLPRKTDQEKKGVHNLSIWGMDRRYHRFHRHQK